jgi:hypothetical protein
MQTPSRKSHDRPAKRSTAKPESRPTRETFPRRTDPPGKVGLGNETRPGLGTRMNEPFPGEAGDAKLPDPEQENDDMPRHQRSSREPNDRPLGREPREQRPDTWAHEAERDTGASGKSGV